MHPLVTRRIFYPAHERLLGRSTVRFLRQLEESQWGSPDELRALQRHKLQRLLQHAVANVGLYRDRMRRVGVDPLVDDPRTALNRLSPIDKSDIRAAGESAVWRNAPGGVFTSSTGGSTGEPLSFYLDRRRQAFDRAARLRSLGWFGVRVGDRELYLWGSPIESSRVAAVRHVRDWLLNQRLLSAFAMSSSQMDEYLDRWDRYRPTSLYGYPSSIALFVEHARSRRRPLDTRRLRAVFVTGEICYPHQREAIADYFGVPVANGYGAREAGFIAHECQLGCMHICAENVIVEILDERGEPVPVGTAGEMVVTHLDAYAMPFIRYRTGDIGALRPGRCACGRGLPLVQVVQGRKTDFLVLPDGTVKHALSVIYPLREMRGLRRFRVLQRADHSMVVEVVADDVGQRITREAVARCLRPVIGEDVGLQVRLVEKIDVTDSGKHRYVTSQVPYPRGRVGAGHQPTQQMGENGPALIGLPLKGS